MKGAKKYIWMAVFLLLILLTVYVVTQQNDNFTLAGFLQYISAASPVCLTAAVLCACGFVLFEGASLNCILRSLGYRRPLRRGAVYSAADIYFSAITPSATGGQPASAYFMMHDGVPGATSTITLLINLVMYSASLVTISLICFLIRPSIIMRFSTLSQTMIILGAVAQIAIGAVFLVIALSSNTFRRISRFFIGLLCRLHILKDAEGSAERLEAAHREYSQCVEIIKKDKPMLIKTFLYNLLQRGSFIAVSMFVILATSDVSAIDAFVTQAFIVLGYNYIPLPGGVGAADYLFFDGFDKMVPDIVSTELIMRGISFYGCVIVCGLVTLIAYAVGKIKNK